MRYRLIPKSSTLDDLELKRIIEDMPALSAREFLRTESTFQRYIDYVDIAGRS